MANRYGRRQRRKHREQIEALGHDNLNLFAALRREEKLRQHLAEKLRRHREAMDRWDREVSFLLGRFSALKFKTESIGRVPGRMEIREPMSSIGPSSFDGQMEYRVEMMLAVLYELDEPALYDMHRLLRVAVMRMDWQTSTGNEACYAMSERMWKEITSPEAVASGATARFCQETAEQFMALLAQNEHKPERKTA
jgi:hypothetical protein